MKIRITKQIEIAAAHYQPEYPGKCVRLHGHNYLCELTAEGSHTELDRFGMLVDFGRMKEHLEAVIGRFDHTLLNDAIVQPSVERLTIIWLEALHKLDPHYVKLRVWENPRSSCEVEL